MLNTLAKAIHLSYTRGNLKVNIYPIMVYLSVNDGKMLSDTQQVMINSLINVTESYRNAVDTMYSVCN